MKNTPVDYQTARKIIDGYGLPDFGKATIREVVAISTQLEQETKTEFIHMEMGVPGLKAAQVGVDAEIKARNRLHAGNIRFIPRLRTMYAGKGHDSLYRSGIPCPETADHSHGL